MLLSAIDLGHFPWTIGKLVYHLVTLRYSISRSWEGNLIYKSSIHLNNNIRKRVLFLNYNELGNSSRTMSSIEGAITAKRKGGLKNTNGRYYTNFLCKQINLCILQYVFELYTKRRYVKTECVLSVAPVDLTKFPYLWPSQPLSVDWIIFHNPHNLKRVSTGEMSLVWCCHSLHTCPS